MRRGRAPADNSDVLAMFGLVYSGEGATQPLVDDFSLTKEHKWQLLFDRNWGLAPGSKTKWLVYLRKWKSKTDATAYCRDCSCKMSSQTQVENVQQQIEGVAQEVSEVKASLSAAKQAGDREEVNFLRIQLEQLYKKEVALRDEKNLLLRAQQGVCQEPHWQQQTCDEDLTGQYVRHLLEPAFCSVPTAAELPALFQSALRISGTLPFPVPDVFYESQRRQDGDMKHYLAPVSQSAAVKFSSKVHDVLTKSFPAGTEMVQAG
ncbi:hypothetical protein ABBQ38_015315 [Trebouxia sp. C0009 RCD-2024]